MDIQKTRNLLLQHGMTHAAVFALTESQLRGLNTMTLGVTDPDLLRKKIKDWRKTIYVCAAARAKRDR